MKWGKPVPSQAAKDDALSSLLGQETRSTETLQKIDAIEAQMSGQWAAQFCANRCQGKNRTPRPSTARPLVTFPCWVKTAWRSRSPAPDALPLQAASYAPAPAAALSPAAPAAALPVFHPDPDLEEAAILFAHGDMDGARTRLLEQLVQALSTEAVDEDKAAVLWHAVLDLCRATGDEEAFEPLAIDYAAAFRRSAPLWAVDS